MDFQEIDVIIFEDLFIENNNSCQNKLLDPYRQNNYYSQSFSDLAMLYYKL